METLRIHKHPKREPKWRQVACRTKLEPRCRLVQSLYPYGHVAWSFWLDAGSLELRFHSNINRAMSKEPAGKPA